MNTTEIAIIGSGPGGSVTAALLAEQGKEVVLIEKGKYLPLNSCEPFSQDELVQKYRNSGLTVAFGDTKVSYVEGMCVGGGSEVNSALYFRTPPEILSAWSKKYRIAELNKEILQPYFEMNERELSVSFMLPDRIPLASLKLHQGAQALGWKSMEVPRWYKYQANDVAIKQSMTETMIPRALASGITIKSEVTIDKITRKGQYWVLHGRENNIHNVFQLKARVVFLCSGATSTPLLLRRSRLSHRAGKSLHMHPMLKITARFPEIVNYKGLGVSVHQVKEFSPRFSFGCSVSSYPYLALAMMGVPDGFKIVNADWQNMAIYYSMIVSGGGSVSSTVFGKDPLVKYNLGQQGIIDAVESIEKLGQCLFEAGAQVIYPSVVDSRAIYTMDELRKFKMELLASSPTRLNITTIHLFASCPMGEDLSKCVVDSFGKVHGQDNLYVNDSSMLCSPLGVNPQGTIMAIARRNVEHFLQNYRG